MQGVPRVVIAGLKGGSGKTTLSLGLIRELSNRGMKVVPFKKGPDYIDAGWLAGAASHACYNLDPFLIGRERLLSSFLEHAGGADIAVIEGNRGLFDGMDEEGSYSTAEVSKILRAPVILVVDCTKATRTIAAVVLGALRFDQEVAVRGVVLNQIAGKRHESVIRKSIEKYCDVAVLGAIPRLEGGEFPERHMGLLPRQEHPDTEKALSFAAEIAGKYLDVGKILAVAHTAGELASPPPSAAGEEPVKVRIGVVRDSAFQFYYPENFEELRRRGAGIVEVSALSEPGLPEIDALYIGGGFPETHAIALAENEGFRDSLRRAIDGGLPVYAECGGLMYLGEALLLGGRTYPMAGIFPLVFSLEKRPQAHGYSIAEVVADNPFYPIGTVLRGHEFHYSRPLRPEGADDGLHYAFRMQRGQGIQERADGLCRNNVLATYTHVHAYGAEEWADGLIRSALAFSGKGPFRRSRPMERNV